MCSVCVSFYTWDVLVLSDMFVWFVLSPKAGWDIDGEVVGPDRDVSWHSSQRCWGVCTVLRLNGQEVLQVFLGAVFVSPYICTNVYIGSPVD